MDWSTFGIESRAITGSGPSEEGKEVVRTYILDLGSKDPQSIKKGGIKCEDDQLFLLSFWRCW